jgi:hypothetical protein
MLAILPSRRFVPVFFPPHENMLSMPEVLDDTSRRLIKYRHFPRDFGDGEGVGKPI